MGRSRALLISLVALVAAGCGGDPAEVRTDPPPGTATASVAPTSSPSASPSAAPSHSDAGSAPPPSSSPTAPAPGTVPPDWLGTRVLPTTPAGFGERRPTPPVLRNRRFTLPDRLSPLPGRGFASRVTSPAPAKVLRRSTWRAGCPVAAEDLDWVRLTFWGFDDRRHTGELLVHASVAEDLVRVFRTLYAERFPIEEMRITRRAELDAPPTGDGNDTGAFNCRPTTGGSSYSQHAYGLAIDINPFQNPYLKGDVVLPELAGAYLDRGRVRPGMVVADDVVVRAFAAIGWEWGGAWRTLKDYQHFSQNGR